MGFWTLFEVASMPVLQVLIISLLGAYMATEYCNLLPSGARRSLNRVCCFKFKYNSARFRLILKVCWVAICKCRLCLWCLHLPSCLQVWPRLSHLMTSFPGMLHSYQIVLFSWIFRIHEVWSSIFRWFMIVNVGLTFLFGSILGWIVVKLLKPKPYQEGLVIATCSSGNSCLNFLTLIIDAMSSWSYLCSMLLNI